MNGKLVMILALSISMMAYTSQVLSQENVESLRGITAI